MASLLCSSEQISSYFLPCLHTYPSSSHDGLLLRKVTFLCSLGCVTPFYRVQPSKFEAEDSHCSPTRWKASGVQNVLASPRLPFTCNATFNLRQRQSVLAVSCPKLMQMHLRKDRHTRASENCLHRPVHPFPQLWHRPEWLHLLHAALVLPFPPDH
jgi:hypothetical protein